MTYYSQNGEDVILAKLFSQKPNGFFVEVGCIDGRRFSNTLHLEEMGWQGVCVEAHRDYIPLLRENRPGSWVVHAAVSNRNSEYTTFYADRRGSLSTLNPTREEDLYKKYGEVFTGFEEQIVPMKTLNSILSELGVQDIDILSLDIEGHELEALEGLSLEIHDPRVLVIETEGERHEQMLDGILMPNGYRKIARVSNNIFYCHPHIDSDCVEGRRFNVQLCHTGNPFYQEEDQVVTRDMYTHLKPPWSLRFRRMVGRFLKRQQSKVKS